MLDIWMKMMMREVMIGEIQMAIEQHHGGTRGNRERAKKKIIGWILRPVPWLSNMWAGVMLMVTAMNDDDVHHDQDGDC